LQSSSAIWATEAERKFFEQHNPTVGNPNVKLTRMHVNGQALRNNPENNPVFVVRTSGGRIRHASGVEILGPSKLVYNRKRPMPAHAKSYDRPVAWIQTNAPVLIS
jgi:hypothetical protein